MILRERASGAETTSGELVGSIIMLPDAQRQLPVMPRLSGRDSNVLRPAQSIYLLAVASMARRCGAKAEAIPDPGGEPFRDISIPCLVPGLKSRPPRRYGPGRFT